MDGNNKIVNQNMPPVTQADQAQTQAVVQPIQPVQPVVPAQPVGSVNKEVGPITAPVSEFVKPSEVEPQISKDLKDLGIEAKKDEPNIADEHKGIIEHAKQFTPISSSPTGKVVMPMSEEEMTDKLKTGRNDDSGKWLAGLIRKIIKWGLRVR